MDNPSDSKPVSGPEDNPKNDGPPKDTGQDAQKTAKEERCRQLGVNAQGKDLAIAASEIGELNLQFAAEGRATKLSIKNFHPFDKAALREERSKLYFEPEGVDELALKLQQRRLLILAGEPEIGKTSLALLVASSLWLKLREPLKEAALCRSLESNVLVDFADLTGRAEDFHDRVLILGNAFATNNEGVMRFASQLNPQQLEIYVRQLRSSQSFLLLTADVPGLPGSQETLKSLHVLHEVPSPSPEVLLAGLRHLVERLLKEPKVAADSSRQESIRNLFAGSGEIIAQEIPSLSRLERFVREYLSEIAGGSLSLQEALKRTNDLGYWLLSELPGVPEVWCAVLALTLCSAGRRSQGISWFEFEALQRELLRFVRREMDDSSRRWEIPDLCRSELTLERARAEVISAPYPEPDAIRFRDPRYPDHLWQVLLGPGRGVMAALMPLLRRLSSNQDPYLRQCASQALGRIGQADPYYITYPLIQEWSAPDASGKRSALDQSMRLGHLFEGILGAKEDADYQQGCLEILRWRAHDVKPDVVQIATDSLYRIAMLDDDRFQLALSILKELAEKRLKIQWQSLREISRSFRSDEEVVRFLEDLVEERGGIDELRREARQLLERRVVSETRILGAFRYTLTGLLLSERHRGETLRQLITWMRNDSDQSGPLIAFAFLGRGGIASWLECAAPAVTKVDGEDRKQGSPLLESACVDAELALVLHNLVETLFLNLRNFPGMFRQFLEQNFLSLLAGWAREGRSISRLREPVTGLLARLFASRNEELSERMLRLAQEPAASPELEDLRVLAIEAIMGRRSSRPSVDGPREVTV